MVPFRPVVAVCLTLPLAACSSDPEVARNNPPNTPPQFDAAADGLDAPLDELVPEAQAEASKDGCVSSCFGRQCGSDGCGGICGPGCAQGTACLDDGTCDDGCVAVFSADQKGLSLRAIALDQDGLLYASGYDATRGLLRVLSQCSGAQSGNAEVLSEGALSTSLSSVAIAGDFLYVGGTARGLQSGDPGAGIASRVNKTLLSSSWSITLAGSAELDEIHFLSIDDTGGVWAGGVLDASASRPWLLRLAGDGKYCAFDGPGTAGVFRASFSAAGSGAIYLAGESDGHAFLSRHASGSCWQSGECADSSSCQPAWTTSFDVAGKPASPRDLVIAGAYAYVVGELGGEAEDTSGFVAAISLSTGNVGAVWEYNPTPKRDMLAAIAADVESGLYVTGSSGWDGDSYAGAARVTAKLLAPTLELAWKHESASELAGRDIAVDPRDGVYFVSDTADGSRLVRCTKAGLCP